MLAHQAGNSEVAVELLSRALKCRPDYVRAHNNLGVALSATGNGREAFECYQAALKIDPNYAEAYNNRRLSLSKSASTSLS